ncbi:MAG: hypothetical protein ACRDYX_21125 [Egibacteraceae bacterium]
MAQQAADHVVGVTSIADDALDPVGVVLGQGREDEVNGFLMRLLPERCRDGGAAARWIIECWFEPAHRCVRVTPQGWREELAERRGFVGESQR